MAGLATIAAAAVAAATVACLLVARLPWFVADEAGIRLLRPGGGHCWFDIVLVAAGTALAIIAPVAVGLLTPVAEAPAGSQLLPALCLGVAVGAAAGATPFLLWIDLRIRRLPDRIVLPLIALTAACLIGSWAAGASGPVVDGGHRPLTAVVLGVLSGLLVLLVSVIGGRGRGLAIGLGDVKLAVVLGSLTALVGTGAVLAAFVVAQVCALCEALVRVAVLRQGMATRIAYGPHLLLGMWTGPLVYAALR